MKLLLSDFYLMAYYKGESKDQIKPLEHQPGRTGRTTPKSLSISKDDATPAALKASVQFHIYYMKRVSSSLFL